MKALVIEFRRCGWGYDRGLIPMLRLGVIAIYWCRESIHDRMRRYRDALLAAAKELSKRAPSPDWQAAISEILGGGRNDP